MRDATMQILRKPICWGVIRLEEPLSLTLLTRVASVRKLVAKELKSHCSMRLSDYRILSLLDMESAATARDMQKYLASAQSVVSESISRLKRKNAITRSSDHGHSYVLTPEGMKLLSLGDDAVGKAVKIAFDGVPFDLYLTNSVGALLNMAPIGRVRMRGRKYFLEFSLLECTLLAEAKCIEASRRYALSLPECRIMLYLYEVGGGVAIGDLASKLDVSFPHVSELCGALVKRGMCEKTDDSLDGRKHCISLTPDGVDLVRAATPDIASAMYEVTANRLSKKEQDAAVMLSKY